MDMIENAVTRIDNALGRLERALDGADATAGEGLQAERDLLESEVLQLRKRAEEDARLRAEAASAVREALSDLRGAVASGQGGKGRANA